MSHRSLFLALLGMALAAPVAAQDTVATVVAGPRQLTPEDLAGWKTIRNAALSADGRWFGHVLAPNEGDAEVVLRTTSGPTEHRFAAGDVTQQNALTITRDGAWAAFLTWPTAAEAKKLRKDRKPVQGTATLVALATGEVRRFEKVRRIAFAGDRPGWVALHGYPDAPAGGGAGAAPATSGGGTTAATLLLHDLGRNATLAIGDVGEFGFDERGEWLAWTIDTKDRLANGVQFRHLPTDAVRPGDFGSAVYRRLTWADSGSALAVMRGIPDTATADTLFAIVAWTRFGPQGPIRHEMRGDSAAGMPEGLKVSPDRTLRWSDDLASLSLGLRATNPPKDRGAAWEEADKPVVEIWHGSEPRLQPMQKVQEGADKSFSWLAVWHLAAQRLVRLADEQVRDVQLAPVGPWAIGFDQRAYELDGNLTGRRYRDVYVIDQRDGSRRLALTKAGTTLTMSPDGSRFAWFEDGHWLTQAFSGGPTRNLTAGIAATFWNDEDDHNVEKPARVPLGWTHDSRALVLTDGWDLWRVPVAAGPATNLTVNGKREGWRYRQIVQPDPRARGIDLTRPVELHFYGERTKREGFGRIMPGRVGVTVLLADDAQLRVTRARDADRHAWTRGTFVDFPDWWTAAGDLRAATRLTTANPQQQAIAWSAGARLVDYVSAQGDTLQAALFLPAGWTPGTRAPTVVYIYEKLSQSLHQYAIPNATRYLNPSVYTSRGYAILMPDITYTLNDPGMSAVWAVLPALDAAIATGVVDPDRVGLQGHSWGGYQTAFLVTQTDRFKGAIAGAPLTDMISMYSSVYWNSGSANQPIFVSSQGRFLGNYLDHAEAYRRNSPNRFADRVTTPLIIMHNDKDGAVDFNQGVTYFNTLRELGKEVVMLSYPGENHGLAKRANQIDYATRMQEFFDAKLRGLPEPDWYRVGVPRLQLDAHLRARRPPPPTKPATAAPAPTTAPASP
jgi:dipeptidyl aminopeptidase/acylaminoacyl peptidase